MLNTRYCQYFVHTKKGKGSIFLHTVIEITLIALPFGIVFPSGVISIFLMKCSSFRPNLNALSISGMANLSGVVGFTLIAVLARAE